MIRRVSRDVVISYLYLSEMIDSTKRGEDV